jgi:hypothetical protein
MKLKTSIGDWKRRYVDGRSDQFENVGDWLKLENDCGFKSSLFFFAETIDPWHPHDCNYGFDDRVQFEGNRTTVRTMMREIASRGWDIGLHGSIASATEAGVLARQKREIETVIDRPVQTMRQHYLQYDPHLTAMIQAQAGFLVDGTIGFNDVVGFRTGTSFPHRIWDWSTNSLLPLWEIPLHIQDGALLSNYKTVEGALEVCCKFLDKAEQTGGCLSVLFHPHHLATDFGNTVYREFLQEAHRRNAWGCSMQEAALWWSQYTGTIMDL